MKKRISKVMICLLAVFMCIQNIDIAFATNNTERSGTDKSNLFQKDSLKIYSEGNLIYDSDNPSVEDGGTINYSPRISFDLEWSQKNTATPEVVNGDFIVFDLFDIKTDGNELKNFSSTKNLLIDHVVVATGELYAEDNLDGTKTLKYKVIFNQEVEGKVNIVGTTTGQFYVEKGTSNGGFTITIDGEKIYEMEIVPSGEKPGGGVPSPVASEIAKDENGYGEVGEVVDPKWVIKFTHYLEHGIQEYRDSLNSITPPTYENAIFEEILDAHQTFESEDYNRGIPNLDIQFPMVMNVIPSDNTQLTPDGKLELITRMQYTSTTLRELTEKGVLIRVEATDQGMSDNQTREDYVRATPLTWTIITESEGDMENEHLIINLGAPGGDLLNYNKVMSLNTSKYKPFGKTETKEFKSMDDVLDDLDKEISYYKMLVAGHDDCSTCELTNESGDTRSCKYWKEYLQAVIQTKEYYASNPSVFGFRFYLRARLKDDEVSQGVSSVTNAFKISCGSLSEEDDASLDAKWNGTISMEAAKGEVQLLKADSLYENDESSISSGNTNINGPLEGIGFEVYDSSDNKLYFKQDNESKKYVYDDTNSGTSTVITNNNGTLIIKGLENGKNYYFKEVDFGNGYYTGLNDKVKFTIDYSKPTFVFVENEARGVEFVKVDENDSTVVLEGAQFTLYKKDAGQVIGFTKKTIDNKEYYVYDGVGTDNIFETDANGKVSIVKLPAGEYWFEETKAPVGYELSKEKFEFELNDTLTGDAIYKLGNISNKHILGSVSLEKIDANDSSKKLEGAKFILAKVVGPSRMYYSTESETWVADINQATSLSTDDQGIISVSDLELDETYIFIETEAPTGYDLPENVADRETQIDLDVEHVNVETTFENNATLGSISLKKVDADDTSKALFGAKFILAREDSEGKREYYTLDQQNNIVWATVKSDAKTLTTDNDGIIKVEGLDLDETYIFIETEAPTGYDLPENVADRELQLHLDVNHITIEESFTNNATLGSVVLKKVDADDTSKTLSGAEFILAREDNLGNREYYTNDGQGNSTWVTEKDEAKTLTTETDGELFVDGLDLDTKYVFIETKAPIGYELTDNNETVVTLDITHVSENIVVENEAILGSIEITKVDNDTSATLQGAEFILAKEDSTIRTYYSLDTQGNVEWVNDIDNAEVFTTDSSGQVTIDGLPLDIEYILIETKAPIGYELPDNNETKVTLDVTEVNASINIKNEAILGSINIVKVDADDNHTLEGATFILAKETIVGKVYYTMNELGEVTWDVDVNKAKEFNTDSAGKINIDGLALDVEYTLIETKAPLGYELPDNNETKVTLDVEHVDVSREIENHATLGSIEIMKVDADDNDKVLSGAEFVLSKEDNQSKVYYSLNAQGDIEWMSHIDDAKIFVTDDEGKIKIDGLDLNQEYILIETEAPEGYELSEDNEYKVTLELDDKDVVIVVENQMEDHGDVLGEQHENNNTEKETEDEGEVLGETHVRTSDDTHSYIYMCSGLLAVCVFLLTKKKKMNS